MNILTSLLFLHSLKRDKFPEVPDEQTTAAWSPFPPAEDIVSPFVQHPHLILALENPLDSKRGEVPNGDRFVASSQEDASLGVNHHMPHC